MCGIDPEERTFLGHLPHFHKVLLKRLRPRGWGGAGQSALRPRCCHWENLIWGLLSCNLGPQPWWRQWLIPKGRDSFDGLPCWSFAYDLVCLWAVTRVDWKSLPWRWGPSWDLEVDPLFSRDFNLLWNNWPFKPITLSLSPEVAVGVKSVQPA